MMYKNSQNICKFLSTRILCRYGLNFYFSKLQLRYWWLWCNWSWKLLPFYKIPLFVHRFCAQRRTPFYKLLKQNVYTFPDQIWPKTLPLKAVKTYIVYWREYPLVFLPGLFFARYFISCLWYVHAITNVWTHFQNVTGPSMVRLSYK